MIGWLLDTNVVSSLVSPNGAPSVKNWALSQPEDRIFVSILTFGEYDKGIHNLATDHPVRPQYIAMRDGLELIYKGRILSLDDGIVRRWGEISGSVRRQTGHPPAVVDTLLAATAIEHRMFLVTRNIRDVQHSGAAIFNPWADDPANFPLS